jgi:hypothetical protein
MSVINICGFELGAESIANMGEGGLSAGSGGLQGTSSIVTSPVRSGQYAARCNPVTTATGYFILGGINFSGLRATYNADITYVRFYFRYATKPSSNSEIIFTLNNNLGGVKLYLRLNSASNLMVFDSTDTQVGSTGATVLNPNSWYRIEVSCGNGTSGSFEVKLAENDNVGRVEISGTGNVTTTNGGSCHFGKSVDKNGNTVDFYYDDISISDTNYPGPGKIVRLDPISDSADVWTTGTFADVNDYATQAGDDGDTTYSTSSIDADNLAPNCSSATTVGITGIINVAKAFTLVRDENQTVNYFIRVYSSTTVQKSTLDGEQTYIARAAIHYGQISPININTAFRAGVERSQAQSRPLRCTAMCVMIDYTPAPIGFMFQSFIKGVQRDIFRSFMNPIAFSITDIMELLKPKQYPRLEYNRGI